MIPHPISHTQPTVEVISTQHNNATLNIAFPVSYVNQGSDQDGKAIAALGNGPSDGYEKTTIYSGGLPGCILRVMPNMASGSTYWDISESGGAVVLKWSAIARMYSMVAGFNVTPGVVP